MNNPTLTFLYRNILWISLPLMIVGLLLLGFFIAKVVKIVKKAEVLRVPLVARQEIEFSEAGRLVLCGEGPLLTSRFAGLKYVITGDAGTPVSSRMALFRARTTGLTWVRMEMRSLDIPRTGRYVLQIEGLGAARDDDGRHWIVFMRPHLGASILCVLGIILGAALFIVNLVFFLLRLTTGAANP